MNHRADPRALQYPRSSQTDNYVTTRTGTNLTTDFLQLPAGRLVETSEHKLATRNGDVNNRIVEPAPSTDKPHG